MDNSNDINKGLRNSFYLTVSLFFNKFLNLLLFTYVVSVVSQEDYGFYVTAVNFVLLFRIFSLTGMKKEIIRSSSKDESSLAKYLENTVAFRTLLLLFSCVVCIVALFFIDYDSSVKNLIYLYIVNILLMGFERYIDIIFQTLQRMEILAIISTAGTVFYCIFSFFCISNGYGVQGLIFSFTFVNLILVVSKLFISRKFVVFRLISSINVSREFIKNSLIFSGINSVSMFYTRFDIIMLSLLTTPVNVGIYAVAFTIASQFRNIKGNVSVAFFPVYSKMISKSEVSIKNLLNFSTRLFIFSFLLVSLLFFYIEEVVVYLFGNDYKYSGTILTILLFQVVIEYTALPFLIVGQTSDKPEIVLYFQMIMAFLNIPLNLYFFKIYGVIGIAYSTLLVLTIGNMYLIYKVINIIQTDNSKEIIH